MSSILVIGATGNVGQPLVRSLAERGTPVRALVRDAERARTFLGDAPELVAGDVADPASLARAMAGIEALFLLTNASPDMVAQQTGALRAAKAAGVRKVVKLSVNGAAADSPVTLGRWHAAVEREIVASGLDWVHLRPGFFMQNFLGDQGVRTTGQLYAPVGGGRVALIDAADIAAVGAVALTSAAYDRQALNIVGREAPSYAEIAAAVGAATGRDVGFVDVPPEAAQAAMRGAGLPEWFIADFLLLLSFIKAGYMAGTSGVVEEVTGRPARSFAEFARAHPTAWQ